MSGRWRRWLAAPLGAGVFGAAVGLVACGAGVGAKYEGDVRFERCMSLDWQADVDARIRRACWAEWSTYFTAGQTRDRIEYAEQQAGLAPSAATVTEPLKAVPEPTNVFAPPPMLLKEPDAGTSDGAKVVDTCTDDCVAAKDACLETCDRGRKCERSCAVTYTRCLEKCR